jgi:hypothetical protein
MRGVIMTVLLTLLLTGCAPHRNHSYVGPSRGYGGPVYVNGHYRSGTYVAPYTRASPGFGRGWGRR